MSIFTSMRSLSRAARHAAPLLLAGVAGCAALGEVFREPDVDLQRVVLRSLSITGGSLDHVLGVYNPNQFDLRGTELRVGFDVEGSHVGDVTYADDFTVQRGDTSVVTLPLRFTWTGVSGAVRTALERGDVPYTMRGEATLDTPIGPRTIGFSGSGRVPLTRAINSAAPGGE